MWQTLDRLDATVQIKDTGRIQWNEATHRLIRYPDKVDIRYDTSLEVIGLSAGTTFPVTVTDEGEYRIEIESESLTTMGVSFSGTANLTPTPVTWGEGEPEPPDGLVSVPYPE